MRYLASALILSAACFSSAFIPSNAPTPRTTSRHQDPVVAEKPMSAKDAALGRARKQAKMLDSLYKTAIVIITKNYVNDSKDLAAGDAFQMLFDSMKEQGFHEVRLLDASGEAIDDDNLPQNDYEKAAVKAILAGQEIYEEVVTNDGKQFLKSTTAIPMVMDKCIMCHENYEGKKIIGALGITLEIE